MKRYRLAVCKGVDCKRNGSDAVFSAVREELTRAGLEARCEAYRGGCYGLCELGPNLVVREHTGRKPEPFSREDFQLMGWPGEAYYGAMTPEAARQVVSEHIGKDEPVTVLLGQVGSS